MDPEKLLSHVKEIGCDLVNLRFQEMHYLLLLSFCEHNINMQYNLKGTQFSSVI